jgi:hypothetical protein
MKFGLNCRFQRCDFALLAWVWKQSKIMTLSFSNSEISWWSSFWSWKTDGTQADHDSDWRPRSDNISLVWMLNSVLFIGLMTLIWWTIVIFGFWPINWDVLTLFHIWASRMCNVIQSIEFFHFQIVSLEHLYWPQYLLSGLTPNEHDNQPLFSSMANKKRFGFSLVHWKLISTFTSNEDA